MSAFYLRSTYINKVVKQFHKVILILDKFFMKYDPTCDMILVCKEHLHSIIKSYFEINGFKDMGGSCTYLKLDIFGSRSKMFGLNIIFESISYNGTH